MIVTITNTIGSLWATPEQLTELTDEEVIEMIREDMLEFCEGAKWTIEREKTA